jgi:hypothetical protein
LVKERVEQVVQQNHLVQVQVVAADLAVPQVLQVLLMKQEYHILVQVVMAEIMEEVAALHVYIHMAAEGEAVLDIKTIIQ